jgi:low temperature requirement protein LtrA
MQIANYKCSLNSGQPFIYTHLPLMISLVIIGVCVEHLIAGSETLKPFSSFNWIFCSAILLWLGAFIVLQHVSMWRFNLKKLDWFYLLGSGIIIGAFFIPSFSSLNMMLLLNFIFFTCLIVQLTLKKNSLTVPFSKKKKN